MRRKDMGSHDDQIDSEGYEDGYGKKRSTH
jgi:hypothetical protein